MKIGKIVALIIIQFTTYNVAFSADLEISIPGFPQSLVTCTPSNIRTLKNCKFNAIDEITSIILADETSGISYRSAPTSRIEIDIEFRNTGENFYLVIDGQRNPLPDTVGEVAFPIPSQDHVSPQSLNIAFASNMGDQAETVPVDMEVIVKGMRVVLDDTRFSETIKSMNERINDKETLVSAFSTIIGYANGFGVMRELTEGFYSSLTNSQVVKISDNSKMISEFITRVSNSDKVCFFDDNEENVRCLTGDEVAVLKIIHLAIKSMSIPDAWKDQNGKIMSFNDFLFSMGADTEKALSLLNLLSRQSEKVQTLAYKERIEKERSEIDSLKLEISRLEKFLAPKQ